jgi:DNA-binding transcriptional MerR regulator
MERYLLAADVARLVGITPAMVRQAARAGRLHTTTVTESGVRLFTHSDVEQFLRERAKKAGEDPPLEAA